MVSINDLYNDLVTLINQNFYTKSEIDDKQDIVDITDGFKSYLSTECEVSSSDLLNKTFVKISDDLEVSLESLFEDYFDDEDVSVESYFQVYSRICEDYILGVVLSDGSVSILSNPEFLLLDEYSLTLSSNRSVLSYVDGESATVTATLLNHNSPVSGETVLFSGIGGVRTETYQSDSYTVYTVYGEGKIRVIIDNNRLILIDPLDGTSWYQK